MPSIYDNDLVIDALSPQLSWKNSTETGYDIVDCDEPLSGRYFNDGSFHQAVTVKNIFDCQTDAEATTAEKNQILIDLKEANIKKMLGQLISSPTLVESGMLFSKYENTTNQTVTNGDKYVGERFMLSPHEHALLLNNVTLYFDGVVTFTLYLVNEFYGIVDSWIVTTQANKQVIYPLNTVIRYHSEFAIGGEWFLCYDQADLGEVKAINYSPRRNKKIYTFGAMAFSAAKIGEGAGEFDKQTYTSSFDMYGINVQVSAYKDFTNLITQNVSMFDELQGLMMAATVLDMVITTHRSNATELVVKEYANKLYWDLNGLKTETGGYVPGINDKIKKELKAVKELLFPKPESMVVSYE